MMEAMRGTGRSTTGRRARVGRTARASRLATTALGAVLVCGLAAGCSLLGDDDPTATTVPNGVRIVDLEAGTCFQAPANTDVRTVEERPCDEPHDAEAYAVFALAGGADAPYPGGARVQSQAQQGCQERFADYVGQAYEDSAYYFTALAPTRKSWEDRGDRRVLCSVISSNEDPLTASVRADADGGDG